MSQSDDYRYPPIEPRATGMLEVGDGNAIHWMEFGTPGARPAVVLHGGPGSGAGNGFRRSFDPERYHWISFNQRGCGLSTPHASDPATDMAPNTTQHLIDDIERLREHFGFEQWQVMGASWGSALTLAYAQQHPDRVSAMLLVSVATAAHGEFDWLYWSVRRFIPEAFHAFHALAPETRTGLELAAAYSRLLEDRDPAVRAKAAEAWVAWEDAVISHEVTGTPGSYSARVGEARTAFVRICAHYAANGAFLEDGELLRNAGKLVGIPGVLIHGRLDLGCPLETPWALAKAWPGSELIVVDSGHTGNDQMRREIRRTLDRFASA